MKLFSTLLFFSLFTVCLAQKQTYNWYFGYKAGISFHNNTVTALQNGAIGPQEGCSTISDTSGNLIFYTDGRIVRNRNHDRMPNDVGLLNGDISSTQSGLIVPDPGDDSSYYVFSLGRCGNPQPPLLYYSIVNMRLDSGMGDIDTAHKNVLIDTMSERLAATSHCNSKDYWLLSLKQFTPKIYAYPIDSFGIQQPIISTMLSNLNCAHTMKVSPCGNKIAISGYSGGRTVAIFDFNNYTGHVTFDTIYTTPDGPYGLEWTSDNQKVYVSQLNKEVYQIDLQTKVITHIGTGTAIGEGGALQMGPDGRIYFTKVESKYLGVIPFPLNSGTACGYIDSAIYIGGDGRKCQYGLPAFVSNLLPCSLSSLSGCNPVLVNAPAFLYFHTSESGNKISLSWEVAPLREGGHFQIQRADENGSFQTIKTEPSLIDLKLYSCEDFVIESGVYYYRIQLCEGSAGEDVIFSETHRVDVNMGQNIISLFPNPCTSYMKVYCQTLRQAPVAFAILDLQGKSLNGFKVYREEASATCLIILEDLAPGIYFLETRFGETVQVAKFVKR